MGESGVGLGMRMGWGGLGIRGLGLGLWVGMEHYHRGCSASNFEEPHFLYRSVVIFLFFDIPWYYNVGNIEQYNINKETELLYSSICILSPFTHPVKFLSKIFLSSCTFIHNI